MVLVNYARLKLHLMNVALPETGFYSIKGEFSAKLGGRNIGPGSCIFFILIVVSIY